MLIWADSAKEVRETPKSRRSFFESGKSKLLLEEYEHLKDYINQMIDNILEKESKDKKYFVPGWQAPGSWEHTPLNIIWDKVFNGDLLSCALWYGLLYMETIIDRKEYFRAYKTNFDREFDQMVYWVESEKSEKDYAMKK